MNIENERMKGIVNGNRYMGEPKGRLALLGTLCAVSSLFGTGECNYQDSWKRKLAYCGVPALT